MPPPEFRERGIVVPLRYITRPSRLGDNEGATENKHVDYGDFERLVEEGSIDPYWEEPLEEGRVEY